jgi:hypothetical protein
MKELQCGHKMPVLCGVSRSKVKCTKKCTIVLKCGHICGGDCYKCVNFSLHCPCKMKIESFCACGRMRYNRYCGEPASYCPKCEPRKETDVQRPLNFSIKKEEDIRKDKSYPTSHEEQKKEESKFDYKMKSASKSRRKGEEEKDIKFSEVYQDGLNKMEELRRSMRRMRVNYNSSIKGDINFINQVEVLGGLYFNHPDNEAGEGKYREVVKRLDELLEYRDAYFNNLKKEERDEMMERILNGKEGLRN